jgi:hypothetical protein
MLTLMTTIALTLIFRSRRRAGALPSANPLSGPLPLPRHPVLRGLALGFVLLVVFVPASIAVLSAIWTDDWSFERVLGFKIVYGIVVGWVATPLVVLAALRERR